MSGAEAQKPQFVCCSHAHGRSFSLFVIVAAFSLLCRLFALGLIQFVRAFSSLGLQRKMPFTTFEWLNSGSKQRISSRNDTLNHELAGH